MIQRADVIMLHQVRRVEIVDEGLQILVLVRSGRFRGAGYFIVNYGIGEVFRQVEVLVDAVSLGVEGRTLLVSIAEALLERLLFGQICIEDLEV